MACWADKAHLNPCSVSVSYFCPLTQVYSAISTHAPASAAGQRPYGSRGQDARVMHHGVDDLCRGLVVNEDEFLLREDQVGGDARRPAFGVFDNDGAEHLPLLGPLEQGSPDRPRAGGRSSTSGRSVPSALGLIRHLVEEGPRFHLRLDKEPAIDSFPRGL